MFSQKQKIRGTHLFRCNSSIDKATYLVAYIIGEHILFHRYFVIMPSYSLLSLSGAITDYIHVNITRHLFFASVSDRWNNSISQTEIVNPKIKFESHGANFFHLSFVHARPTFRGIGLVDLDYYELHTRPNISFFLFVYIFQRHMNTRTLLAALRLKGHDIERWWYQKLSVGISFVGIRKKKDFLHHSLPSSFSKSYSFHLLFIPLFKHSSSWISTTRSSTPQIQPEQPTCFNPQNNPTQTTYSIQILLILEFEFKTYVLSFF